MQIQIKEAKFKNKDAVILENKSFRAVIIPKLGAKIASFYSKKKDFELLFQNKEAEYADPSFRDDFEAYDCSGFDDCFPNIDASSLNYNGREIEYADHGEIWSAQFDYKIIEEKVVLNYYSDNLDYSYQKEIYLEANKLKIDYKIKNESKNKLPAIWAMHCLINYSQAMELRFPPGVENVENAMESKYLGQKGEIHPFPVTKDKFNNSYRLDRVNNKNEEGCEKYYVLGEINAGCCSVFYPEKKLEFKIKFDSEKLPYLGFWLTEGGFKGDYNCAFEPADGYYDSVNKALKNNKVNIIKPGSIYEFSLELELN